MKYINKIYFYSQFRVARQSDMVPFQEYMQKWNKKDCLFQNRAH